MTINFTELVTDIKQWARELGFQQTGISDIALHKHEKHLHQWLSANYHGEMGYMAKHGSKRSKPDELVPGTLRIISTRMDYLPADVQTVKILDQPQQAYISRYALGRDYHKLIRKRLGLLAKKIQQKVGEFGYRAFVDSAPVLERALAEKAGLGWIGKNTMLINRQAGSWFFLGELFTDLPLPVDAKADFHCGSCQACLDICPTNAFVTAQQLDATRCISYLTIELKGSIPPDLRPLMGNRIFGCDDCQLICPWNKFSKTTKEQDFSPRHQLDCTRLIDLFKWTEQEFLQNTEGSAIRRIGYVSWLRNIAVALGNALVSENSVSKEPASEEIVAALKARQSYPSSIVQEHVIWALQQQHDFNQHPS